MANSTFTPVEYSKHIWQDGEVITKEKLQNIEDAISVLYSLIAENLAADEIQIGTDAVTQVVTLNCNEAFIGEPNESRDNRIVTLSDLENIKTT